MQLDKEQAIMVREPDATMQLTPQDNQLMSKHRVLSFKPQLRLEWRGQDGQNETEQPDHSASLGDSSAPSTRIGFSVHTPCCGGELHVIGETVSEMLDHVPARLRVIRICRPRYGCRACGTIHQAPAPERPIAKGLASPGLLAHVLVAKYCDHLPLYRQSQIF